MRASRSSHARSGTLLTLALVVLLLGGPRGEDGAHRRAHPLGPLAELAADLEWIRFQRAHLRGDEPAALLHAERALAWNPREARGWRILSAHVGLFLASVEREPDPAERARLLAWAVRLTQEGERRAGDPGSLAFHRGLLLLTHADVDPEIAWPGGGPALLAAAVASFERAASFAVPGAADLAEGVRHRIESP